MPRRALLRTGLWVLAFSVFTTWWFDGFTFALAHGNGLALLIYPAFILMARDLIPLMDSAPIIFVYQFVYGSLVALVVLVARHAIAKGKSRDAS